MRMSKIQSPRSKCEAKINLDLVIWILYLVPMQSLERIIFGTLGFLLFIVFVQAVVPHRFVARPKAPVVEVPCKGSPITVDFAYTGMVNEPWTCKVQCDDDQPRYILYTNGKATQCEIPPGCNDTGEDTGQTCTVSLPNNE